MSLRLIIVLALFYIYKEIYSINYIRGFMKVICIFDEKGKTLQEVMEQFLIIYFNDNIIDNP